ncbi:PGPS1 [Hepatospora eriocheir]|uniref:CDP-diacylglycerol--glycerol-3-phosphate 3-phosphatidyltransferase n=1 Tax=Hepatospora eriocheir TaxID=1081669 RepID=A0A1X0QK72_9MICR|nr:PGPS1 [Hepatospora eriocheir]
MFCMHLPISNSHIFELDNLQYLSDPDQFYKFICKRLKESNYAYLACLNIGTNNKSVKLFKLLRERVRKNKFTKILIPSGSYHKSVELKRLINENGLKNIIDLVDTDTLYILPKIVNDFLSIFHIKCFIFDNEILLTGANLDDDYFTNRVDRYIIVKNDKLKKFIIEEIFKINMNIEVFKLTNEVDLNLINQKIICIPFRESNEFNLLKYLFELNYSKLTVSSAYSNFPVEIINILKNKEFNLYTPSPSINIYQNFGIFNKVVTNIYSYSNYYVLSKCKKVNLYEYNRKNTSFHKKGIWMRYKDLAIMIVGSSNYNCRSIYKDKEMSYVLFSKNSGVINTWEGELKDVKKYSEKISLKTVSKRHFYILTVIVFYLLTNYL